MRVGKKTYIAGVLGIFWGLILLSMLLGGWQAKESAEQVVVKTADDIKGWMTIEDVSKYLKLTVPEIAEAFSYKSTLNPKDKLKDFAEAQGKTSDDYKEMIDKYIKAKKGGTPTEAKANEKSTDTNSSKTTEANEDIKGYMTFQYVADKYHIPVKDIYKKLNIPEGQDPKVTMKDVSTKYNFEVQAVRDLVAGYRK